jgi:hypothetical protein
MTNREILEDGGTRQRLIILNAVCGYLACWAVRQLPTGCPDGLEVVIRRFREQAFTGDFLIAKAPGQLRLAAPLTLDDGGDKTLHGFP